MTAAFIESGIKRREDLAGLASMSEHDRNAFLRFELGLNAFEAAVVRTAILKNYVSRV